MLTLMNTATLLPDIINISTSMNKTGFPDLSDLPTSTNNTLFPEVLDVNLEFDAFRVVQYIVRYTESFLALGGNSLTLVAISKYPNLRTTTTHVLIAYLAYWDIFGGLIMFLQTVLYFLKNSAYYPGLCLASVILPLVWAAGNAITTFFIALDRFLWYSVLPSIQMVSPKSHF